MNEKNNKIKDLPAHERPREKLLTKGAQALADWELLAIILGRGTQKNDVVSLSKKLITVIDEFGIKLQAQDILKISGIGEAKATTIAAAFEFVRRRIRPDGLKITSPLDVIPLLQHYSDRKQEHFICISVNGANEVIQVRVITIGLVNQSQVHPREVFADVIAERATSVIVAHNHPSGNVKPSQEDINITKRLKEAAKILGIHLLDHIIFSRNGHYSLMEHGEL
jgi:DNA repair protein RadC